MPDKDDTERENEEIREDEGAAEKEKPAPRRSKAADAKKKAAEEQEEEEDELSDAVIPPARGGSGALVAVIVILIVAILVAGVWWQQTSAREHAKEKEKARLASAASSLGTVHDRVEKALRELDRPEPNVERAIETLNDASESIGVLAQGVSQMEGGADFSLRLTDLQKQIREATQDLDARQAEYEETVKAAHEKLKSSSTESVRPIANKIAELVSHYTGEMGTPIVSPMPAADRPEPEGEAEDTEAAAEAEDEGDSG
jgi:uncharacterized protein HemX